MVSQLLDHTPYLSIFFALWLYLEGNLDSAKKNFKYDLPMTLNFITGQRIIYNGF